MNTQRRNKMMMYDTVAHIIAANETSWTSIPAFHEVYNRFSTALTDLKVSVEAHSKVITGFASKKSELKSEIVEGTIRFIGLLTAYGEGSDNTFLVEEVTIPPSTLRTLSDRNRLSRVKNIFALVNTHLQELEDYGLTEEEVNAFGEKLDAYDQIIVSPREAIINRRLITLSIRKQIKAIDALLKKELDPFILALKPKTPNFAELYDSARNVIDYATKKGESPTPPKRDEGPQHGP